jgi:hypothetical protein
MPAVESEFAAAVEALLAVSAPASIESLVGCSTGFRRPEDLAGRRLR